MLLRPKLTPPRRHRTVLARPALAAALREALDYRLTLVQAGTGYGKSTALAALAGSGLPLFWYSVAEGDADPQRFLSYLIGAFRLRLPELSQAPLALLEELSSPGGSPAWSQAVDALVNALSEALDGPAVLVVDDYHFVANSPEVNALLERFVCYLPADLHVIVSARYPLDSPQLIAWRARGEVLDIGHEQLVFSAAEIEALFRDAYGVPLAPGEVAALADKTEGWPIALQLVWQGLRTGVAPSVAALLAQGPSSLGALFDYLARDILDRQPPELAAFLRDTAVLRTLSTAACAAVSDAVDSAADGAAVLGQLHERDLFVVALGGGDYRYHHLFHDFLREQARADGARVQALHRRAAEFYREAGNAEEAIYHWLSAAAHPEAAGAIAAAGEPMLRAGRLDTLARWIDALPAAVLAAQPALQALQGDVCRLRSRFEEALRWYAEAERLWRVRDDPAGVSRALRGQALVYLDTVRPAQAESLLEEALRLTDGLADRHARARLLELLAENKLNMGKPAEAEGLRAEARALREAGPGEDVLSVRVKLRTGRLAEAERILAGWAAAERDASARGEEHAPRAHRETVLILALIHAMRGEAEQALARAREGIALGERLGSPFISAVGHTRLGHALQLAACPPGPGSWDNGVAARDAARQAEQAYRAGIALGDSLAVRRMRVEAMWGLTRTYGYGGDLTSAERAAAEGAETGRWAGDPWIVALIELALGASYVLAGRPERAPEVLGRALAAFRECGDSFGRAAARLWLALAQLELRQSERLAPVLDDLLALCETHGYDFLLTRATLLGVPDPRRAVPLLIEARERRVRPAYAARLLGELGLGDVRVHPGYQLRVQVLGAFRVRRGAVEVEPRAWQRDKARQLFQLLLSRRGRPLQREEITERLWPERAPEAAGRDFKVALNALNRALEPGRPADGPPAYVVREGSAYAIRPEADIWLDAAEFERAVQAGLRAAGSDGGGSDGGGAGAGGAAHLGAGGAAEVGGAGAGVAGADGAGGAAEVGGAGAGVAGADGAGTAVAGAGVAEGSVADAGVREAPSRAAAVTALQAADGRAAAVAALQAALALYGGDYLPGALYDDWASEERERLQALYLQAADRLAGLLIDLGRHADALTVCQAILARDACWERAYRLEMLAHAGLGNRPQALRAYQRCVSTLRAELDVAPSPATQALYERVAAGVG